MVEMSITLGLMGAAALVGANMISQQSAGMRSLMARSEANAIHESIRLIVSDSESCSASVKASSPIAPSDLTTALDLTTISRRRFSAGVWTDTPHYQKNKAYGGGLVEIASMQLRDFLPEDLTPGPKLVISYRFLGKITGVAEQKRSIDLSVSFTAPSSDPTYNFSCSGGGGNMNTVAVQMVSSHSDSDSTNRVEVQCPAGTKRISCMGSREKNLSDTCAEDGCGIIGVGPIPPEGCATVIDSSNDSSGTKPIVWATCIPL